MKNKWKMVLLILLCLMGIASFLAYLNKKGVFDPVIIGKKYCYFYYKNDSGKIYYNKVFVIDDLIKAKMLTKVYFAKQDTTFNLDGVQDIPVFQSVSIIRYTADSTQVRVKYSFVAKYRPFYITIIGYVPRFTLYDTIPKDTIGKVNYNL